MITLLNFIPHLFGAKHDSSLIKELTILYGLITKYNGDKDPEIEEAERLHRDWHRIDAIQWISEHLKLSLVVAFLMGEWWMVPFFTCSGLAVRFFCMSWILNLYRGKEFLYLGDSGNDKWIKDMVGTKGAFALSLIIVATFAVTEIFWIWTSLEVI